MLLFLALLCASFGMSACQDSEKLLGWLGESYRPEQTWSHNRDANETDGEVPAREKAWIETLSNKPRAYLYHNFLSDEECDIVIESARPYLKRSTVVGTTGSDVNSIRTSEGTFISRHTHPGVERISNKIADWVHIESTHQEDIQVLRYSNGQKYGAHMDVIPGPDQVNNSRMATVLLYLTSVEAGGETTFPQESSWVNSYRNISPDNPSDCARGTVYVKPRRGDALLFFSLQPDGSFDAASVHGGCPVTAGEKWTAAIWIHEKSYPSFD